METYIFKFSACLAVFWLVYILFLERQTMHRFKRVYLLVALASALLIPTLTLTEYVEPIPSDFEVSTMFVPIQTSLVEQPQVQAPFFDLETVLWMLYGLGVVIFAVRFLVNLIKMYKRISTHEQIEKRPFIYVLLEDCRIPHSFFKYLFFERSKYETDVIPDEVKLHEETHAKQLHSLDIIAIELLQIVFWFHPLIYIVKHHIKLNHEFLADQAVLDDGIDTKAYQKTLLQFSSNTYEYQLSSAINYSSIKKRFTVMKTQTSKTRMWLSSLLLLPIFAILFYSFAEREYVEKEPTETLEFLQMENTSNSEKLTQQKPPTEKEISAYNAWVKKIHAESKVLSDDATFFPPINEQDLIKFSETYKRMSPQQKNQSIDFPFPDLDVNDSEHSFPLATPIEQEKATAKQVAEYNTWAKSINSQMAKAKSKDRDGKWSAYPIVKQKDVEKYKYIYGIMTEAQKKGSEPWPSFPPPPPPPVPANPPSPKSKDKTEKNQNKNTIQPIEITIKKDNSLVLNGDPIKFEELTAAVDELNSNLTIKEKRSYVTASIKLETNDSKDLAKKIGLELTKVDVFSNCIIFNNDDEQQKITSNHISPNAGLTIEEAKAQQEKDLKAYEDSLESQNNKTKSPWAISMGVNSVEAVDNSTHKQGPIDINGANYYFTQQHGKTTYYDSFGKVVDINKIPPPPPIPNNTTPEQKAKMKKATDAYLKANPDKVGNSKLDDGEIIEVAEVPSDLQGSVDINGETFYYTTSNGKTTYYNRFGKEVKMDNLPPPAPAPPPVPESPLDFVIKMAKTDAKFFNEGKSISSDDAIALLKKNPKLNINAQKTDTKQPLVYISKKPMVIGIKDKN